MSMFVTDFRINDMDEFLNEIDNSTEFFTGNDGEEVEVISVEALARILNNYIDITIKDLVNE
jgi:hypothetical protein